MSKYLAKLRFQARGEELEVQRDHVEVNPYTKVEEVEESYNLSLVRY